MRPTIVVLALLIGAPIGLARQESFDSVVARLKLPDPAVRLAAIRLLAESGYPEAGPPIAALLDDPDERVQRAAMYAELGLHTGTRVETKRRVGLVVEVRDAVPAAKIFEDEERAVPLTVVPVEVVTRLLPLLRHSDPAFRREALWTVGTLARLDSTPAPPAYRGLIELLAERLGDPEPVGRVAAARVAGRVFRNCTAPCAGVNLDRLGDALTHTLNDPERVVRVVAMEAIGDLRWDRAVQSLSAAYDYYGKGHDALAALITLARIGHPSSLETFRAALGRREADFRRAAAEGLATIGTREAVAALEAVGATSVPHLDLIVSAARFRAGQREALDRLVQALDIAKSRATARAWLVALGQPVVQPVSEALAGPYRGAAAETRVALIEILGATAGQPRLALLEPMRQDRDARVAAAATRAVMRIVARVAARAGQR